MASASPSNKKRVMVTGGLGFIGSHFIDLLLKKGYSVVNVDKKTYAARTDLSFDNHSEYRFIHEDIALLRELPEGIDYIVNFAAESHVDNSIMSNEAFFNSNVRGVHNLLELLRVQKPSERPVFVHISTDEVYGDTLGEAFKETSKLTPSNPYSATKAAADQLITGWGRTYGIKYKICRSGNNYGYGQYAEKLIPKTIKFASKGEKMTVHGNGSYEREWLYVGDNCEAIFLVMEKGEQGGIYNITSGETWTNLDIVKMILKEMGKPEDFYTLVDNRTGQDIRYSVNPEKIKALGWSTKMDLKKYIPEYVKLAEERSKKMPVGMKGKLSNYLTKIREKKDGK